MYGLHQIGMCMIPSVSEDKAETYSLVKNNKLSLDIPDHKSPTTPLFQKMNKNRRIGLSVTFFSSISISNHLWTIYTKKIPYDNLNNNKRNYRLNVSKYKHFNWILNYSV